MPIHTYIPDGSPVLSRSPELEQLMPVFAYDPDAYRQGLALAGVSESVIDELKVNIQPAKKDLGTSYDFDAHQVTIAMDPDDKINFIKTQSRFDGYRLWTDPIDPNNADGFLQHALNFSLALEAQTMSDTLNRHPSVVAIDKLKTKQKDIASSGVYPLFVLGGNTLAGGVAELLHYRPLVVAVGGTLLSLIGMGAGEVLQNRRRTMDDNPDIAEHKRVLFQQSIAFAKKPEVREVFSQVIKLS